MKKRHNFIHHFASLLKKVDDVTFFLVKKGPFHIEIFYHGFNREPGKEKSCLIEREFEREGRKIIGVE